MRFPVGKLPGTTIILSPDANDVIPETTVATDYLGNPISHLVGYVGQEANPAQGQVYKVEALPINAPPAIIVPPVGNGPAYVVMPGAMLGSSRRLAWDVFGNAFFA